MKNTSLRFVPLFSFLLTLLAFLPGEVISQTVLINPGSPWTVPAGVTQIKVEIWGGGGGGGGTATLGSGGGGGGGGYNTTTLSVSAGQTYSYSIGTGGGSGSNANGVAGTATTFSNSGGTILVTAGGGGAGLRGNLGNGNGGAAGTGLNSGAAGSGGGSGGAGGGAGGNFAAATGVNGGTGSPNAAPYKGGNGGASVGASNNGSAGGGPGGGGGGAVSAFGGSKTGGSGAAGQVIITYCDTYSLTSMTAPAARCVTNANATVTLAGSLPIGSYTVTYSRSSPAATGLTANMTVSTANTGTFVATGLTTVGPTTITVTNIGSATSTFCTNNISANNTATVNIDAAGTVDAGPAQTICATADVTLAGVVGGTASTGTWSGGTGSFNPNNTSLSAVYTPSAAEITAGTATLTLTTNNPPGVCNAVNDQVVITIKKAPTAISITPPTSTICVGNSQALTAAATIGSNPSLSSENFNTTGSFTYAAAGSNSGGGTAFSQQASGYVAGLTTITNNDASQFMIATASALGSANTNSTLTSPVINTAPYGSLNFSFRHTYQKGSEAGVSVQVSTNGGSSWSNISIAGAIIGTNTYTANQGANNNFVTANINLGSFINNANFRIRFNFVSNVTLATSWWAIDDIALNGVPLPVFSWAASTGVGINGLSGGAGTLSASNKNITVNPTATTTYTVTAYDITTNCGISTVTATVNVNQNSTLALSSAAGTDAQTICMPGTITDITYDIGGDGTGASLTAGSLPAGLTASYNSGVFTISGTPTEFGNFSYTVTTSGPCVNPSLSGTLTVNTAPGLTCQEVVTNTDPGVCFATRTYVVTATGFPAPTVSYLVDGNFIDFPYDFPLGVTTVDVLAEGACAPDASCSFTVTVNDEEAPVADLASLPDATGECSVTVTDTPTATDACEGSIPGTTTDPLSYTAQGTYTITWLYEDSKGNISTQEQTVIVNDVTPPDITCPVAQAFCSAPGNIFTIPLLVATDNCTVITSVTYEVSGATTRSGTGNDASGLFNAGVSTIEWTVTDGNNNSSSCSTIVTVSVPPLAPTVTGIVNVCPYLGTGDQITYIASSPGATSYNWTLPPNVNVVSGLGTGTLVLTFNTALSSQPNKQLRVTASNNCGTSSLSIFYLLTQFPVTPNPITGPTSVCQLIGTANTATYSISPVIAAIEYVWSTPAGTSVVHPNGPGINDTIINVTFDNSFAGGVVSAIAANGCGTSGTRTLSVPKTPSSAPGLISGPTNVCASILPDGAAATYTIVPVNGATSYTWTAPPGAIVTHPNGPGANDITITVQFPVGFNNGTISVSSTNGCGTSGLRSLAVNKLNPATPSVIDVIQIGFCEDAGGRVYTYTLSSMPANANSVFWTVPAGAILQSGQNTTSITVSYPPTSINGNVTAQAMNSCASSTIRKSAVKLAACPPPGFTKNEGYGKNNSHALPVVRQIEAVNVFPNPSTTEFNLRVSSSSKEIIDVRIYDMQGRQFKTFKVTPFQAIQFGNDLKAGSYLIEIVQGETRITKKILKF